MRLIGQPGLSITMRVGELRRSRTAEDTRRGGGDCPGTGCWGTATLFGREQPVFGDVGGRQRSVSVLSPTLTIENGLHHSTELNVRVWRHWSCSGMRKSAGETQQALQHLQKHPLAIFIY